MQHPLATTAQPKNQTTTNKMLELTFLSQPTALPTKHSHLPATTTRHHALANRCASKQALTHNQVRRSTTATITTSTPPPEATNENRFCEARATQPCILVGVQLTTQNPHKMHAQARIFDLSSSLSELTKLAETAGLAVQTTLTQTLPTPDPTTYIRSGKVAELKTLLTSSSVCTVVFDVELSPGQQRALEESLSAPNAEINVIDRTALILDIFAQHARTAEGKLQVELALYQYRLPRLTRLWTHLERQSGSGGVGLRGPGETQLEVDKRLIQARMSHLRADIARVRAHRTRLRTARRARAGLPVVALIGYTNAGKSTLLNTMAGSDVLAADALFVTLDATTRRAKLHGVKISPEVLLTDTVGFVQNLPTGLVAAFRATLEEIVEADLLLHVVDGRLHDEVLVWQMEAVRQVVDDIGADGKPSLVVVNKLDAVDPARAAEVVQLAREQGQGDVVGVSAKAATGIVDIGVLVEECLRKCLVCIDIVIPYSRGDLISMIYRQGCVLSESFLDHGTALSCKVPRELCSKLSPFAAVEAEDVEAESDDGGGDGDGNGNGNGNEQHVDAGYGAGLDARDNAFWSDLAKGRHSIGKSVHGG